MTHKMNEAEWFFWSHTGYSWDPATETRAQGRRRMAESLVRAEAWAAELGMYFLWPLDEDVSLTDESHATEANPDEGCEPSCDLEHLVYGCVAKYADGRNAGSLWGITDPDSDYMRVVQAELALAAMHETEEGTGALGTDARQDQAR